MDGGSVDLRSDTITRPTPEMRRSMARAEVDDAAVARAAKALATAP